jgi:hypothetical protein
VPVYSVVYCEQAQATRDALSDQQARAVGLADRVFSQCPRSFPGVMPTGNPGEYTGLLGWGSGIVLYSIHEEHKRVVVWRLQLI